MAYGVFIVTRAQSKAQKREKEHVGAYRRGVKIGNRRIGVIMCKKRKGRKREKGR